VTSTEPGQTEEVNAAAESAAEDAGAASGPDTLTGVSAEPLPAETPLPDAATGTPAPAAPEPVRHTHEGTPYLALLSAIHRHLRPSTYLEIGSDKGDSLRLATCTSIAIDPKFKITSDVIGEKPALHLFQQGSDEFFASGAAKTVAPQGIDMAFLDGLHLFEFLLRDFINTERLCNWRSVVLLHDCLPPNIEIAERDYRPHLRTDEMWRIHWTGDVWKLVPILQRFRPDLQLTLFDAPPSGLVMVKGLDPNNRVLEQAYPQILAEYRDFILNEESYHRFYGGLTLTGSKTLVDGVALSAFL
jgi:hypothetical protein